VTNEAAPQFCPWCGAPSSYRTQRFTPTFEAAAREKNVEPPTVLQEALHTDAFVAGCPSCRRVSHVIGHKAGS
jgi:hypothetical protein